MNRLAKKQVDIKQRSQRTRRRLHGTAERPRLSVHVSNLHITAQLINDDKSLTLVHASSVGKKMQGTMSERAAEIGKEIALKAKKAGIKQAIFDRGARLYHGRVKALADAAREGGLII